MDIKDSPPKCIYAGSPIFFELLECFFLSGDIFVTLFQLEGILNWIWLGDC